MVKVFCTGERAQFFCSITPPSTDLLAQPLLILLVWLWKKRHSQITRLVSRPAIRQLRNTVPRTNITNIVAIISTGKHINYVDFLCFDFCAFSCTKNLSQAQAFLTLFTKKSTPVYMSVRNSSSIPGLPSINHRPTISIDRFRWTLGWTLEQGASGIVNHSLRGLCCGSRLLYSV